MILAVGSWRNSAGGGNAGHVRVYEYHFGYWMQLGSDLDGSRAREEFGTSVDLSRDGTKLTVGAGGLNGYVVSYEWNKRKKEWVQNGPVIEPPGQYEQFGAAVAVSGDGHTLIAGSPNYDDRGRAGVYQLVEV